MAISRRRILEFGVSYGTGAINFNNDSVAYDRELRKLPADTTFYEFMDALSGAEEILAEYARIQAEKAAEAEAKAAAEESAEVEDAAVEAKATTEAAAVEEIAKVEESAGKEALATEVAEAEADAADEVSSEEVSSEEASSEEAPSALKAPEEVLTEETPEEVPEENPLAEVIEKARAFRDVCGRLALSAMYMQTKSIIGAIEAYELPSVEEVNNLKTTYGDLIDYLEHC
jgi:hypothetical protein